MENYNITQNGTNLNIEGFDDAVKVIELTGHDAKRLSDLCLHRSDLEFATSCLDAIDTTPEEAVVICEALWRSAIIHFYKCFGDGYRFQLSKNKIYKDDPPEAKQAFEYFKAIRNKHLVHDENSYSQSIPGAILNDGSKSYKIEKVVCFSARAVTLEQGNYSNLRLLVQKAISWVISEFDAMCNQITASLEKEPYKKLLDRNALNYCKPDINEISQRKS